MPKNWKSRKRPIEVEATRTDRREALHLIHVICCDASGNVLGHFGDPEYPTYFRSAAKPFQLLAALKLRPALVEECSDQEIAVMASSHNGERGHIDAVRGLQARYGLWEDLLQCGTHPPYHARANWEYGRDGTDITSVHCNCSGKHTAMLLASQAREWPFKDYTDAHHPMQEADTAQIARYLDRNPITVEYGVDGCNVPTWWLTLRECALCFARFSSPEWAQSDFERRAIERIFDAYHRAAWFASGTGRFETPFNSESDGKWLAKIGGEGIFCVGFRNRGIGLVVKVIDGNSRAIPPALLHAMKTWGLIDSSQLQRLKDWVQVERPNSSNVNIGYMRIVEKVPAKVSV
jgi:L-asparaginase II